jgi:hypothetical protein
MSREAAVKQKSVWRAVADCVDAYEAQSSVD